MLRSPTFCMPSSGKPGQNPSRTVRGGLVRVMRQGDVVIEQGPDGQAKAWSPVALLLQSSLTSQIEGEGGHAATAEAAAETARKVGGKWTTYLAFRKSAGGMHLGVRSGVRPPRNGCRAPKSSPLSLSTLSSRCPVSAMCWRPMSARARAPPLTAPRCSNVPRTNSTSSRAKAPAIQRAPVHDDEQRKTDANSVTSFAVASLSRRGFHTRMNCAHDRSYHLSWPAFTPFTRSTSQYRSQNSRSAGVSPATPVRDRSPRTLFR